MPKLFLIESQPDVCHGLRLLLSTEADFRVVGDAADCATALEMLSAACPDIVVVDIDEPRFDHSECAASLLRICEAASLILLTLRDNEQTDLLARKVGASAVVVKSSPPDALLRVVREVSLKRRTVECAPPGADRGGEQAQEGECPGSHIPVASR